MKVSPYYGKILVEVIKEVYSGKIIVPDNVRKDPPVEGKVLAFGPDVDFVKAGDMLVFGKYACHDVPKFGKDKHVGVIMESDIIYKFEGDAINE